MSESVGANEEVVSLFVASWISLLADSPLEPENKPYALYRSFLKRIQRYGIRLVVLEYSSLAHQLVSRHTLTGPGTSIGPWIDGFADTPVFYEYNRYFKTGDVKILDYLYTFLNFGKKLEYEDKAFYEVAFRDWLDIENKLNHLVLQDNDCQFLQLILSTCLPVFSISDFRPKFGPGAVMERGVRGRLSKLRSLSYDPLIDRFLFHGHIGMYGYGEDHGLSVRKVIPNPDNWIPARRASKRNSLQRFVRKNMKTARSIGMEPNVVMYSQQGVLREFLRLIKQSELCRFIDISDQQRNRSLGLYGSYTMEIDTIDLSAASDCLSVDLVRRIFPPSWKIPMLVTRSREVELPDGRLVPLKKFAPMGSALCFPTQCITFAAVCIYAACLYTFDTIDTSLSFDAWLTPDIIRDVVRNFALDPDRSVGKFMPLAVYGDDICVDSRLTQTVMPILGRLGFVVNEEKSFTDSQTFRETCGGYYLNGHDITPLYFRIKGVHSRLGSEHVASQVHLINEAYECGYRHLYRFLHASLMTWGCRKSLESSVSAKNSIPYVSDPSQFGIRVSADPVSNSHLKHREQPDPVDKHLPWYQRTEVRAWAIRATTRKDDLENLQVVDAYEYLRWWADRTTTSTMEVDSSALRYDTGGSGLCWRWIPAQ